LREADFDQLYAAHAGQLFSFLAYRTGNRALAEDLLADTFERAFRARRRFDRHRGTEKSWLYTIALNCLRDHQRRLSAEERALVRSGSGEPEPVQSGEALVEQRDLLGRALESLSAEEREAIALRFGSECTLPEIAELTGEPLTTVEGRVYRALRKLRGQLEDAADLNP
jgi:RNA polymerase sigma factor (sigma-70 family)